MTRIMISWVVMLKKCLFHNVSLWEKSFWAPVHHMLLWLDSLAAVTSEPGALPLVLLELNLSIEHRQHTGTRMLQLPKRCPLPTDSKLISRSCLWKWWIYLICIYLCALTKSLWIRPDTRTLRSLYRRILRSHTCTSADSPSRRCRRDRSPRSSVRWSPEDTDTPPWRDRRGLRSDTCTADCSLAPSVCHRRLEGNRKHCWLIQTRILLVYSCKFDFCLCDLLQFYLFVSTRFGFEEEKNTIWKNGSNVNQTLPPVFTLGISSLFKTLFIQVSFFPEQTLLLQLNSDPHSHQGCSHFDCPHFPATASQLPVTCPLF